MYKIFHPINAQCFTILAVLLTLSTLLSSHNTSRANTTAPPDSSKNAYKAPFRTVTYTYPRQNPILVRRGRQFILKLKSEPSIKYHWELAGPLPEQLKLIKQEYIAEENDSTIEGHEYWTFEAKQKSSVYITLRYVRYSNSLYEPRYINIIIIGLLDFKNKKKSEKTRQLKKFPFKKD